MPNVDLTELQRQFRAADGGRAFFEPRDFPWVAQVEACWPAIRAELDAVMAALHLLPGFEEIQVEEQVLSNDRRWKILPLLAYGHALPENLRRCPATADALRAIPGLRAAMFSIFEGGKALPGHVGPYAGVLRYHLGLRVPEPQACGIEVAGERRGWAEGRSLVFDDTHWHHAWNHGRAPRVVLFVDFDRPLPEPLAALNRQCLARLGQEPFITEAVANWQAWEGRHGVQLDRLLAEVRAGGQPISRDNAGMTQDQLKQLVGRAALDFVTPGSIVGVGTGSTVDCFIDALAASGIAVAGAVSSSERSSQRMRGHGIAVLDASAVTRLPVYIDGADEIDGHGHMIKGGGAALTREKIVADLAERFICIADDSKLVPVLGKFPLPVEIIPMAAAQLTRRFAALGGEARLREGVVTDNGGHILDVRGLSITDPLAFETEVNQWPGVVTVGVFARHKAQVCLLGGPEGVRTLTF